LFFLEGFNAFVPGAMEEHSDDGKVPAGVNYDKILRLAQQIRANAAK
jgi:hypothetical protein